MGVWIGDLIEPELGVVPPAHHPRGRFALSEILEAFVVGVPSGVESSLDPDQVFFSFDLAFKFFDFFELVRVAEVLGLFFEVLSEVVQMVSIQVRNLEFKDVGDVFFGNLFDFLITSS